MYSLREANDKDMKMLINYKLLTITEYAEDFTEDMNLEMHKYVNENVPKDLDSYKIIVVDGKDIGCLLVTDYEDGVLLDEIYINEEYRNNGIGTSLIENVLSKHNVVYLWVYKKNEKAIKLYEKLGFKKEIETESRYFMKFVRN